MLDAKEKQSPNKSGEGNRESRDQKVQQNIFITLQNEKIEEEP